MEWHRLATAVAATCAACTLGTTYARAEGEFCTSDAESGCISFERAAELAAQPDSGVFALHARVEPALYGILNAYAENEFAICREQTCYLTAQGRVSLTTGARTQTRFVTWAGCSASTDSLLELDSLVAETECVALYEPGIPPRH